MHRNVIRHLRRQRCRPGTALPTAIRTHQRRTSMFDYFKPSSSPNAKNATIPPPHDPDDSDPITPSPRPTIRNPAQQRRLLQSLDQKALLDIKTKLNTLLHTLHTLPARTTALLPPHLRAPAGETAPYVLGRQRHLLRDLDKLAARTTATAEHTRAHIQDLQGEDYLVPGDGMARWKEEVARMSRREREERLFQMRLEEEAQGERLMERARGNVELAERLLGAVRAREKERVLRMGLRRGAGSGGLERRQSGSVEEGVKAEGPGNEREEGSSLEEMQKRLNATMR